MDRLLKKPEALVFDLDGTLIDSAPDLQLAANTALERIGREPLDLPTIVSFIGNGIETLVVRILDATGGADDPLRQEVLASFHTIYAQNVTTFTRPYPDVVQALQKFREMGVPLGICTNKPTEPAREICHRLKLSQYFDAIIGAEPDQPKKPNPQSLIDCINRIGGTLDGTVYVGDSVVDFQTARNGGVAFRLFAGGYLNAPLPDLAESDRFEDWSANGIAGC
ncbi:MAG: HAD-IA family hydrolase [Roseobacter sp.]